MSSISSETLPESTQRQEALGVLQESAKTAFIAGADGLQLIEQRIKDCLGSEAEVLSEISHYLLGLGGKRIRPLLSVLVARMFKSPELSSELLDAAAGIELIHMATLLHDDIIDQSPRRRSKPSAYVEYGLAETLLTGDFLLVKAFGLCAKLDPYIIEQTERACIALTEGEVLEGTLLHGRKISLEQYCDIIGKKTASLFGLATAVGAHCAGQAPEVRDSLFNFGYSAGRAFQMVDDILDITADEDLLGKPSGTDLKQRTPSLVNILWIESGDSRALEFFSAETVSPEDCASAQEILCGSEVLLQAKNIAAQEAQIARESLLSLNQNSINTDLQKSLLALVDYTIERAL